MKISFLEIYNDILNDLLDQNIEDKSLQNKSRNTSSKNYSIKENANKGVYVENLSEHSVETIEEAYAYFMMGLQKKKMS